MDSLSNILKINKKNANADREPQSEVEESKEKPSFEQSLAKKGRQFVLGIENLSIVNKADLKNLRSMLLNQ